LTSLRYPACRSSATIEAVFLHRLSLGKPSHTLGEPRLPPSLSTSWRAPTPTIPLHSHPRRIFTFPTRASLPLSHPGLCTGFISEPFPAVTLSPADLLGAGCTLHKAFHPLFQRKLSGRSTLKAPTPSNHVLRHRVRPPGPPSILAHAFSQ